MSAATPTNPTIDDDRAALAELRDLGMHMVRLTVARAKTDAEDGIDADRTPAFERLDRAVRRTVFLLQHIARECAKADAADATTERNTIRVRQQLIRDIEDATTRRPQSEQDAFLAELSERLDAPEFAADLSGMTVAQASQLVRHDLGLGEIFTHKRRTPEDIKSLAARARPSAPAETPPPDPEDAKTAARETALRHEARLRRQH